MPIIGQVERHNWKVKLLNITIHTILILGSATMVYPLLLMVSGSLKSNVDFSNFTIVPQYLSQDLDLFKKYVTTKYNNVTPNAFTAWKEPRATIDTVLPPERVCGPMMRDLEEYLDSARKEKPHFWRAMAMVYEEGVTAYSVRRYQEWLQELPEFGKGRAGLEKFAKAVGRNYGEWNEVTPVVENFASRRASTEYSTPAQQLLRRFKDEVCTDGLTSWWLDLDGVFVNYLRRTVSQNLPDINRALRTNYNSWADITLDAACPENPYLAERWASFLKSEVNPGFLSLDPSAASDAWRRFLLAKYGSFANLKKIYGPQAAAWKNEADIRIPATVPASGAFRTDWMDFISEHSTVSSLWTGFLKKKYRNIAALNKRWNTNYAIFNQIPAPDEYAHSLAGLPEAAADDFKDVIAEAEKRRLCELPAGALRLDSPGIGYRRFLAAKYGTPGAMDRAYEAGYRDLSEVPLPENGPSEANLAAHADWKDFVRTLPADKIALSRQAANEYKKFVADLYTKNGVCDFDALSADYGYDIRGVNRIPSFTACPEGRLAADKMQEDYKAFVRSGKYEHFFRIAEPEAWRAQWEAFLRKKYGSADALNSAWRLTHSSFDAVPLPLKMYDWHVMEQNRPFLIKEYLKRNYLMVFDTLIMNGSAALNTVIYCFLAVLAALIVNPLCAYGLSRYKPAASYKILLFLLLPMAFPGMVLAIPQFLIIKEFGLLNTFACLILPGMAQGYSIFLLKGFFDSLPKELFESAALDGANEWTVFWNIGMSLSTPILSVIALSAFTAAYANFMLAFLMCQKKSMWTMMVYLYQLQQRSSPAVGFAALLIAAVPTLIVFIFCQNIIIRGIVVPTEK